LLRRLRQRRDIVESVGRDIDTLLAAVPELPKPVVVATVTAEPTATPRNPAGWYPDPTHRYEQRYWDGTTWTDNVARGGQQFRDAGQQQQTTHANRSAASAWRSTVRHGGARAAAPDVRLCTLCRVIAGLINMNAGPQQPGQGLPIVGLVAGAQPALIIGGQRTARTATS
jgi:hypothetical protein